MPMLHTYIYAIIMTYNIISLVCKPHIIHYPLEKQILSHSNFLFMTCVNSVVDLRIVCTWYYHGTTMVLPWCIVYTHSYDAEKPDCHEPTDVAGAK